MEVKVHLFDNAYDSYYSEIEHSLFPGMEVLEIGGGAHPSVMDRQDINYTIIDPDSNELAKAADDVEKINSLLEDLNVDKQYDLVLTKMVLEHVKEPTLFHEKVYEILRPGGKAIHFFACRHSIPAFVNRILPEYIGDSILKKLGNRDLSDSPKYPAFYLKTKGYSKRQVNFFNSLQFTVEKYQSFVGHKYFKKFRIIGFIERLYTKLLYHLKLACLSTVALVVLKK